MLHPEQFGFRKGHSTEHAIAQLVDQIQNHMKTTTTLSNLAWFRNYFTNRKQYICINNDNKTN